MKKILAVLILATFAFAANAQFFVSANIGGGFSSGSTHTDYHITIPTNNTISTDINADNIKSFTGGLRVGYKFGHIQAGIAGAFSMNTTITQSIDTTLTAIPNLSGYNFEGESTIKTKAFTVAPFIRYDVIVAGDVALFVELHGFFSMQMDPDMDIHYKVTFNDTELPANNSSFSPELNTTSFGAQVLPGLTWQLNKYCGIDLYFDFLSLAYASTTTKSTIHHYSYRLVGAGDLEMTDQTISSNTKNSSFAGGLHGSPLLTQLGTNNWVRVGFNFTF